MSYILGERRQCVDFQCAWILLEHRALIVAKSNNASSCYSTRLLENGCSYTTMAVLWLQYALSHCSGGASICSRNQRFVSLSLLMTTFPTQFISICDLVSLPCRHDLIKTGSGWSSRVRLSACCPFSLITFPDSWTHWHVTISTSSFVFHTHSKPDMYKAKMQMNAQIIIEICVTTRHWNEWLRLGRFWSWQNNLWQFIRLQ